MGERNTFYKEKCPLKKEILYPVFRAFPASAHSQWPLAQNNLYVRGSFGDVIFCWPSGLMFYMDVCVCVCVSALVSVSMNVYTCITCMCTVVIQISNHISSTGSMPKYYGLKNKPWNLSSLGMQYCYLFQAVSLLTAANKYFYFVYSILFFTLWHLYSISPNSFFLVDFTIHLLQ